MLVAVGSVNPLKVAAVREAFTRVWPDRPWRVTGVEVNSDGSDQPLRDPDCIAEARNRARTALTALDAEYGVGLYAELHRIGEHWFDTGWVVVVAADGTESIGSTIQMPAPPQMMEIVEQVTEELDDDDADATGGPAAPGMAAGGFSESSESHADLMSHRAVVPTSGYTDGVVSALVRFVHPDLFQR